MFSISVLADDAPPDQFSLSRFYPAVKNCWKPVRTSVVDIREARQIIKLGSEIAGSEKRFRGRPFITFGYCSVVSPLTMDFDSTEMLMFYAENELPAYGTLAPIGGISAPLKMSGMLVQMNAEWHAAAVLAQMSKPGTELIYNHLPVVGDMRTGAYAAGAVETGIVSMALAQMGRHYGYPTGCYLGLTNSKIGDAQAGYEKAMSPTLAAAAGIDFIVVGGLLDALMTFDFGQLVIDNEVSLMMKRFCQQLSFGDLDGVFEEIRATGPAGMYVGNAQTLKLMKSCALLPGIADRERREVWKMSGKPRCPRACTQDRETAIVQSQCGANRSRSRCASQGQLCRTGSRKCRRARTLAEPGRASPAGAEVPDVGPPFRRARPGAYAGVRAAAHRRELPLARMLQTDSERTVAFLRKQRRQRQSRPPAEETSVLAGTPSGTFTEPVASRHSGCGTPP